MRLGERRVLGSQCRNATQPRVAAEVNVEALGSVQLRQEVDIRQPRLIAKAEAVLADQLLDRRQPLADPVRDPLVDLSLVLAGLAQQVEHADVVQRVNVATDDRRHAAHLGPRFGRVRQQRRLWINLFQVFDDRR
ncbi:hypothetical protein D3C79_842450 [compost metagenome]